MTIEQIEFDNKEKFMTAIEKVFSKEDVFRTYEDKEGKPVRKKIIANGNIYLGNGWSLRINKADNGKVYLSIEYFGVTQRINYNKFKNNSNEL